MKRLIGNFTYEQALGMCSYENELLLKPLQFNLDEKLSALIIPNSVVVDYGGNLGEHYHSCLTPVKEWIVVETQMKATAGKEIGKLKFTTEIPKDADIVLCSGVLQYVPNWRKSLIQLLQTGAKLFIFRRMVFGKEKTQLQKSWLSENGGSGGIKDRLIFYPHTTIPKREFKQMVKGVNYVIC